jgi:hypothetical protein
MKVRQLNAFWLFKMLLFGSIIGAMIQAMRHYHEYIAQNEPIVLAVILFGVFMVVCKVTWGWFREEEERKKKRTRHQDQDW